ncbi:hypothetical protein CKAH01_07326 [Colletotrichum kahawae]|uniref:Uncharacterized protein n=1 Tax=Colletotrichum kahawae TaxID=34407 RepID=A0AAD9Y6I0_COLKA|nr:hypothetical protein CKAH01_07326 [Colletotrichum kahawae]
MARPITLPLELLQVETTSKGLAPLQRLRGYRFGVPDPRNNDRQYGFDDSEYDPSSQRSRRHRFESEFKLRSLAWDQFDILHFSTPSALAHFLYIVGTNDPNHTPLTMKELYLAIRPGDKDPLGRPSEEATTLLQFASRLGFSLSQEQTLVLEEFLTGSTSHPNARVHLNKAKKACTLLVAMVFQFTRQAVEYISLYIEADILDGVQDVMDHAAINSVSKPFPKIKLFAWRSSLLHPSARCYMLDLDRAVNFVTWAKISAVDIYGTTFPGVCRIYKYSQEVLQGNCVTDLNLRDVAIFHYDLARLINHLPNVVRFTLEFDHDLFDTDRDSEWLEPLPSQVIECLQPLAHRLQSLTLVIDGTDGPACPHEYLVSTLASFQLLRKLRVGMWCFRRNLLRRLPRSITHLDIRGSEDKTGQDAINNVTARLFDRQQYWLPNLRELKSPFHITDVPVPFNRSIQAETS